MIKLTLKLGLILILLSAMFTACQSVTSKENAARNKNIAEEKEMTALMNANDEIQTAERNIFLNMADLKIKRNDSAIAELNEKMKKLRLDRNSAYSARIEMLEQKNNELKIRKQAYEQSQNNWELFKHEYNADLDDLGSKLIGLAPKGTK